MKGSVAARKIDVVYEGGNSWSVRIDGYHAWREDSRDMAEWAAREIEGEIAAGRDYTKWCLDRALRVEPITEWRGGATNA